MLDKIEKMCYTKIQIFTRILWKIIRKKPQRTQRGQRRREMSDEREEIEDFSPFAFPSSLFANRSPCLTVGRCGYILHNTKYYFRREYGI